MDKYWSLIRKVDQFESDWSASPPFALSCHEGCGECCRVHFTLFAVEVAAISTALGQKGVEEIIRRLDKKNGHCPFLDDERNTCMVYEHRPIICRTQGYPFLYLDDDGRMVSDICARNHTGKEVSLPAKYVLNLETLNKCLSSLNYLYLAEMEEEGFIVPARLDILQIVDYPRLHGED